MSRADVREDHGRYTPPARVRDAPFKSPDVHEARVPMASPSGPAPPGQAGQTGQAGPPASRQEPYRRAQRTPDARFSPSDRTKKRPILREPGEEAAPSLMQRRGDLAKVPRLSLDPRPDTLPMHPEAPPLPLPQPTQTQPPLAARSAPAHQPNFGPDAHLPPPAHLFRSREREYHRIYAGSEHEERRRWSPPPRAPPYDPEALPGIPPRMHPVLPSPAYHTNYYHPRTHNGEVPNESPNPRPSSNKHQFLALFSDFFDTLADSRSLKATLEYQVRSSNTLLQTLQRSNHVFDETVDRRIRQEAQVWDARLSRIEDRLDRMDTRLHDALNRLAADAPKQPSGEASPTLRARHTP